MNNRIRKTCIIVLMAIVMSMLCACHGKENISENGYEIFYLNSNMDGIVSDVEVIESTEPYKQIDELVMRLQTPRDKEQYQSVLDSNSGYVSYAMSGSQLTFDFDASILDKPPYLLALTRAAVTRTFSQLEGVETVSFTIAGEPMLDQTGAPIGPLKFDSFIENAGAQINPDEKTKLTLYFASEDGNQLIKVNRIITYNSNISMDKLVVEQLIAGPIDGEKVYPVIDPSTLINSVTVQDGTCYVNLDKGFLNVVNNTSSDVAIYSIVDSLIELGTINKVQFYVDGKADIDFREKINLNTLFVRNLDLIEQ